MDFEAVLAAMMARLGQRVRVSVFSGREHTAAQVVDVEGVLAAGWDPDVLQANGFDGSAIFRMEDVAGFSLYLIRADFQDGRENRERLMIRTGGVAVAVSPPLAADA